MNKDNSDDEIYNTLQNNNPEDSMIDEYDLYYGENAVPDNEVKVKISGPLSRRPSLKSVMPALFFSILFIIFTYTLSNNSFTDYLWASHDAIFIKHEYWRILTAVFTHSDGMHLLSNMPFFIIFGFILYDYFGFILFPVISLITGVAANIITLWFYPGNIKLVGASGMIYGMVSLWLVLYIFHDTDHTMTRRIFRATGFTLIVLFPETYNPSTSYLAHAAGFIIGILSALIILPYTMYRNKKTSAS